MDQASLFYSDIYEAMAQAIRLMGGAKVVGPKLWPHKSPDAAARLLLDCCNEHRPERLDPSQFMWLLKEARQAGFHGLKHFVDQEAGYERGNPVDPLDEVSALQRQFIESVQLSRRIAEQLERRTTGLKAAS